MPDENGSPPGDAGILDRLRNGDRDAFDDLVRLYQRDVYHVAYRLTRNAGEADDLAQETFLRAYTAIDGFRGEASLRTWLLRIVTNLGLNVVQSARVARRSGDDVEGAAPPVPADAERTVIESERMTRLGPAIRALPPKQRATLMLRVNEGLKFKEIARIMGCTTGTAKANFFHAVAALKESLKDFLG